MVLGVRLGPEGRRFEFPKKKEERGSWRSTFAERFFFSCCEKGLRRCDRARVGRRARGGRRARLAHESRRTCYETLKDAPFALDLNRASGGWTETSEFYAAARESMYTLAPRGFGVDTHRFYEAIFLWSVPIVVRTGTAFDRVYAQFPCLVVEAWSDVTEPLLDGAYEACARDARVPRAVPEGALRPAHRDGPHAPALKKNVQGGGKASRPKTEMGSLAPNILSVFRPRRYERAYARKKWAELSGAEKAIGGIGAILAVGGAILLARWVAGSDIGAVLDAYAAASASEKPKIIGACLSRVHDLRDALSGGSDTKRKTARAILLALDERLKGSDGPCQIAQWNFLKEALSFSEPEPSVSSPRLSLHEAAAMEQYAEQAWREAARLKKKEILARWARERIPSDMIFDELVRNMGVRDPVHPLYGHICTWDVRRVSSMASAFAHKTFALDLSFWDTRNVTDMSKTFDGLSGYVDVSTWDTRNVRNMEAMFRGASIMGDIGAWDVRNVRSMSEMFKGARFWDAQDLSKWDLRSIPSEEGRRDMFHSCNGTITKPNFARFGGATPAVLRLILAQQAGEGGAVPFAQAYREIVGGSKRSHWIWYVWPTLRGVRKTGRPELELPSFECARAYLRDGTLRERLVSITSAAAAHLEHGVTQRTLFGAHWRSDALKYRECCSLFLLAAQCESLASETFRRGLDACGGELSVAVVRVLREDAGFVACARSAPERAYV